MRREVVVTLEPREQALLCLCEAAASTTEAARLARDKAVREAVSLGLPTRLVGKHSHLSAAQISRISRKEVKP